MAEDLNKKMEPEVSDDSKDEEAVEETAAVEEVKEKTAEAKEKKAETKEKQAEANEKKAEAAAAAAVTAEATKEAEVNTKAAKKAEEQAAKEAAKKQAAREKEEAKEKAAKEKAEAKLEKKKQKRAAQQALIDACPPQYRPVSTSKYFWLAFLSLLPCLGFFITLILAIAGRNRNVKSFEKAILAYYIIGLVICLIAIIVIGIALPPEIRENIILSLGKIFGAFGIG